MLSISGKKYLFIVLPLYWVSIRTLMLGNQIIDEKDIFCSLVPLVCHQFAGSDGNPQETGAALKTLSMLSLVGTVYAVL